MRNIIEGLLIVSAQASIMVIAVLILRNFIKKTYKVFTYIMWLVVLLRLCVPIQMESPFGMIEAKENTVVESPVDMPEYDKNLQENNITVVPDVKPEATPSVTPEVKPSTSTEVAPSVSENDKTEVAKAEIVLTKEQIVLIVWLAGAIAVATLAAVQVILLRRRVRFAIHIENNIWETDDINTAFVIGIFRPRVYIPSRLSEKEREHILMHEKMHIRHGDNIARAVMLLVNVFYWWNPLVWVAIHFMKKDMEMFCDESVIKKMDGAAQGAYLRTLLNCSAKNSGIIPIMSFGETNTEVRIRHIMNLKKPKFYIAMALIVFGIIGVVGCVRVARTNEEPVAKEPLTNEIESSVDKVETGEQQSTEINETFFEPITSYDLHGIYTNADKTNFILIDYYYFSYWDKTLFGNSTDPTYSTNCIFPNAEYFEYKVRKNKIQLFEVEKQKKEVLDEVEIINDTTIKYRNEEYKFMSDLADAYVMRGTGYEQYDEIISVLVKNSDYLLDSVCAEYNLSYAWQTPATYKIGGFYLIDLDGDGTEEMLLGENGQGGWAGVIYDIFTIKDGKAISLCSGGHRDRYMLCEENVISEEGSGGASNSVQGFYKFENGEWVLKKGFVFDSLYDEENPWFVCDEKFDPATGTPISQAEVQKYIESYETIPIVFNSFVLPEINMK